MPDLRIGHCSSDKLEFTFERIEDSLRIFLVNADESGSMGGRTHENVKAFEAVAGVLGGGAEPDPLVAEAGRDAVLDHPLQHVVLGLVAHPVQQVAARAHLLQGEQVAALMVHTGQAVADELLGYET